MNPVLAPANVATLRPCRLRRVGLALALCLMALIPALAEPRANSQYLWLGSESAPYAHGMLHLLQDRQNVLWIAGPHGLQRHDGRAAQAIDGLADHQVLALAAGGDGAVWLASEAALLRYVDGTLETLADFAEPLLAPVVLHPAQEGGLWLGTQRGLLRWSSTQGLTPANTDRYALYALYRTDSGRLLAGTSRGLRELDEHTGELRPAPEDDGELAFAIADAADGSLWIGGYGLRHSREGPVGDPVWVRRIHVASNGEIWVGTHGQGLRVRDQAGQWQLGDPRLDGELVSDLLEDPHGTLWVATGGGELHQFGRQALVPPAPLRERRDRLYAAVAVDRMGDAWIASYGRGLLRLRGEVLESIANPCDPEVRVLVLQGDRLWAGGGNGLCLIGPESIQHELEGLNIDAMAASARGLWIAAEGRLGRWGIGRPLLWVDAERSLPQSEQLVLRVDADDQLWVGSRAGLHREHEGVLQLVDTGPVVALLDDEDGGFWVLGTDTIGFHDGQRMLDRAPITQGAWGLVHGDDTGLWSLGLDGARRWPRVALREALTHGLRPPSAVQLGASEGFPPLRPTTIGGPTLLRSENGDTWVAAYGQLLRGELSSPRAKDLPPLRIFASEPLRGQAVSHGQVLPPGRATLRFEAFEANFREAERLLYRHRLQPLDAKWSLPQAERSITYAGLGPGSYRFELEALGPDARWAPRSVALEFSIQPAVHERSEVRVAAALLGLALLVFVGQAAIRAREASLRQRQLDLEATVNERTAQLAQANARLERLASTDPLTGLANRRHFAERADALSAGAASLALLLIDVDDFKAYNDHYGHEAGDRCLVDLAQVLAALAGDGIVGRHGGEEFVLLWPDCDADQARHRAERLRSSVEALRMPHARGRHGQVTISAGLACARLPGRNWASLLTAADQALYRAKAAGRNRVESAPAGADDGGHGSNA